VAHEMEHLDLRFSSVFKQSLRRHISKLHALSRHCSLVAELGSLDGNSVLYLLGTELL
jgi:hypothetical protein